MKRELLRGALLTALFFSSPSAFAYETNARGDKCKQPKFSQIKPAKSSEVAPGSPFSFVVTDVKEASVKVVVKGIEVDGLTKTEKSYGQLKVEGHLPPSLHDEHAKILVTVDGAYGCPGKKGWLVKISSPGGTTAPADAGDAAPADESEK